MSSPQYQPSSPINQYSSDYPNFLQPLYSASFERYAGPEENVNDEDDLLDEFEEYEKLLQAREENRINAMNDWKKKKAECEFQFTLKKSHDLEKFFEPNLFLDDIPIELDPLKNQCEELSENKFNKSMELYEDFCLASIFTASYEDVDNEYATDKLKFDDQQLDEIKIAIPNEKLFDFYLRDKSTDRNLFIERNLFSALQYHYQIDQEYVKNHFPVANGFDKINIKHFQSADRLIFLQNRVQEIAERDDRFKNLFCGRNQFQYFQNLLKKDKYVERMAIIMYLLFVRPDVFKNDRDKKLIDISVRSFSSTRYKYFTVSDIFRSINVFFFEDFCNFRIYKSFLANSLLANLRDYYDRIRDKRTGQLIRRKIRLVYDDDNLRASVLNDVMIRFMDPNIGLNDDGCIEEEPKRKSANVPIKNDFDYSQLKQKEIRHQIIKF